MVWCSADEEEEEEKRRVGGLEVPETVASVSIVGHASRGLTSRARGTGRGGTGRGGAISVLQVKGTYDDLLEGGNK